MATTEEAGSEQQRCFEHRGCGLTLFKVEPLIRTIEWAGRSV